MNRLIIESLLIFVITYLLFELLNKYIEVDRIIILILSFVIAAIYYVKRSNYEHLENVDENQGENHVDNIGENIGNKSVDNTADNSSDESGKTNDKKSTNDTTIEKTGDGTTPVKLEIKDQKIETNGDLNINLTNNTTNENKPENTKETNKKEINEPSEENKIEETPEKYPETVLEQTNEACFTVNNINKDRTLNYFSDKNIQKIKKGKAYDDTFTNHVISNIDKQNTRNQFQTDNDDFNVNGHSNIPEKLEDISIEGLKDPDVITNENQYNQYGGYIDANSLYVPRDYQYTDDDYGWNFIPPLKWIDLPDQNAPRVPLCVSANGNCRVNASLTIGYPITVKTWNESRKVMGPSHIDTNYIKNHLNTVKPPESIKS